MKYRAIFIGGPIDGQERATFQRVTHIDVLNKRACPVRCINDLARVEPEFFTTTRYGMVFAYGSTLIYSSLPTVEQALTHVFDIYKKYTSDQGAKCERY